MKIWLALIFTIPAWAYPVFYKCEDGGRLADAITPPEMAAQLRSLATSARRLSATERESRAEEICQGGAQCMTELRQLLELAQASGAITAEMLNEQMATALTRVRSAVGVMRDFVPMDSNLFANLQQYNRMTAGVAVARECRVATEALSPDLMKRPDGRCTLGNFRHWPYMFPSGYRVSGVQFIPGMSHYNGWAYGDRNHEAVNCQAIDDMAMYAVLADQDPYTAMAISLMENATDIQDLYLDPVGELAALGCEPKQVTAEVGRANEARYLNSFNTFHSVTPREISNPALVDRIGRFLDYEGIERTPGTTFVCGETTGTEVNLTTSPSAIRGQCCLRLPFLLSQNEFDETGSRAVLYSSLQQYVAEPLHERYDNRDQVDRVALRLQRFNGSSRLMGGAEGVPAWRSGVDYIETPAYSYQTADFIINTLLSNPYVRLAVERAEERLGRRTQSVLCAGRPDGVYRLEDDVFANRHARSPRMRLVEQTWRPGVGWAGLPRNQRRVLRLELNGICTGLGREDDFCDRVMRARVGWPETDNLNAAEMTPLIAEYLRRFLPRRRTVAEASLMDEGYTWERLTGDRFEGLRARVEENPSRWQAGPY